MGGCATGDAKITSGYDLPARYVIHTVGPVWHGGNHGEDELLASCYRAVLRIVEERALKSVAFPSISTGAYGFPVDRASRIAVCEIRDFLATNTNVERIAVVCFGPEVASAYRSALTE